MKRSLDNLVDAVRRAKRREERLGALLMIAQKMTAQAILELDAEILHRCRQPVRRRTKVSVIEGGSVTPVDSRENASVMGNISATRTSNGASR